MPRRLPILVAHRGLHDTLPENSLAAIGAAWDAGIEWCECDVHLSADGIPVVIHDDTLDRTTTGRGPVANLPASELQKLKLLGPDGKPTEHRLPFLDDLLSKTFVARHLLVETKPLLGKRIHPIAKKIQKTDGMLQSFHVSDLLSAQRATRFKCPVALLSDTSEGLLARNFTGRFHVNYQSLTRASYRLLSERGAVGVWTVNDPDEIRNIRRQGEADLMITDRPLQARQIFAEPLGLSYEPIDPT